MMERSKYCTDIMKKHFNKELVINKRNIKEFKRFQE